ncbi:hypothetical protein BH10ACI2_BH10ACI2_23800 [soil metagenome]
MNSRKSQNSILVLATLGVYLGLVLVGATPQVLASAAMTRQFNVKDEIEFKEDLDNKPDDERSPVTASVQVYLEDVEYFLASLGQLKSKGKFDPAKDTFSVVQHSMQPCVDTNIAGSYTPIRFDSTSDAAKPALQYFIRGMIYGYSLGDCLENNAFHGTTATDTHFDFKFDSKDLLVNVVIKKESHQRAADLIDALKSTIKLYSTRQSGKIRQKIIENTKFRAENDQVFVVTRLPRGSLSSLLATDSK